VLVVVSFLKSLSETGGEDRSMASVSVCAAARHDGNITTTCRRQSRRRVGDAAGMAARGRGAVGN